MQKLLFEEKWDKTIADTDRTRIEQIFQKANIQKTNKLFIPIRQAINHKQDLLVTVLIHNLNNSSIHFSNKSLSYYEDDIRVAEYTFTLPSLSVEPNTSMPWTFIFPNKSLHAYPTLKNGELIVKK